MAAAAAPTAPAAPAVVDASRAVRRWALGLAAWSAFVWGTRINNLVADGAGAGSWAVSGTLSVVSLGLAAAVAVLAVRAWRRGWPVPGTGERRLVGAFAAWTVVVWIVRGIGIAVDWRSAGFVVVHVVLAVVSVVLAGATWRALGRVPEPAVSNAAAPTDG